MLKIKRSYGKWGRERERGKVSDTILTVLVNDLCFSNVCRRYIDQSIGHTIHTNSGHQDVHMPFVQSIYTHTHIHML